jgi:hypothetical protein
MRRCAGICRKSQRKLESSGRSRIEPVYPGGPVALGLPVSSTDARTASKPARWDTTSNPHHTLHRHRPQPGFTG